MDPTCMENLDADPGIGNLKQSGDLASKVVNIDGKPIRSSLKTQGMSQVGGSYAQTVEKGATVLPKDKLKGKHINFRVGHLREELDGIQKLIDRDPFDLELRRQESECQKKFLEASLDEECFLKQKSKVDWLAAGDQNTAFFHNTLKSKNHRARIDVIMDREGVVHEGEDVQKLFVTHYVNFLGCAGDVSLEPYPELFSNRLDANVAGNMVRSVTDMEIKNAMFAIGDHKAPGLVPSIPKSTIYFCNVQEPVRMTILSIMSFVEGSLPVKYLGVPLISSRLLYKDCKILVEKLEGKILNWRNRMLSFAGRLQLILSVLSSMHIYWASVFILPARVILELEAKMRGFLWSQGSSTSRAKVSWKSVCLPKSEGGLGIRRIGDMNKSLMASHVWSILMHRKSLWVEWIHSHRLPLLRQFFWVNIGNGISTSAWFDKWCEVGPLSDHITMRAIHSAGFSRGSSVADIYSEGSWLWPSAWYDTFPVLINIHGIVIDNNATDTLWWRVENRCLPFSASTVWDAVRYRRMEVNWVNIVWFSQCIPRHAFVVWLVMRGKLLTQDKIVKWDLARRGNMNMMCCLLCYSNIDSHSHLFFECKYANSVWDKVKERAGMSDVRANWNDITSWLCSRSKSRSLKNVVARLLVAGAVYYIWQERNNRLFNNHARPPDILSNTILDTIRYRLMGLKLKQTEAVVQQLAEWKIDVELYDQVDG
ncbi:hypothetical protein QVD17_06845 [Tagetes erecta]|uniref:Reverse transcriptase zinc-binding domain-containing protein n=1 Tax=Tagetes erecta TaxID=13708 RepID=A0AAD8LHP0_TARER|nr:hypothetical protein QVD17_06845 [Tagetes erecta]